jgi:hypothetical protein
MWWDSFRYGVKDAFFGALHAPQEYCKTTKIKRPFRGSHADA